MSDASSAGGWLSEAEPPVDGAQPLAVAPVVDLVEADTADETAEAERLRLVRLRAQAAAARRARLEKLRSGAVQPRALATLDGFRALLGILDTGAWDATSQDLVNRSIRLLAAGGGASLEAVTEHGKALVRIFDEMLGQRTSRLISWSAEADAAGMESQCRGTVYAEKFTQTAQLVVLCSHMLWASLAQNIKARVDAGDIEAVSLCIATMTDEAATTLRLRDVVCVGNDGAGAQPEESPPCPAGSADKQTVKVLQSALSLAIVTRNRRTGVVTTVKGAVPCRLQCIDRHTAEVLVQTYRDLVRIPGYDDEFARLFNGFSGTGPCAGRAPHLCTARPCWTSSCATTTRTLTATCFAEARCRINAAASSWIVS
ncbi:unnamed protein product [Prorocentrum cordatum]|uniref:DUF222 domain-containing protein n=1 Tax=Prorocentrum cordatum TaxID=2364126 RepID=A0ABN9UPG0_9DINO|nr:unnamed protein product [Polarella glacialis]